MDEDKYETEEYFGRLPAPRSGVHFANDESNFKHFVVTPQDPRQFVKDNSQDPPKIYELPMYTPTMALGYLTPDQELAMRSNFKMHSILDRHGYHNLALQQFKDITDRIVASQSRHGFTMDHVTGLHYTMSYGDKPSKFLTDDEEGSSPNPIAKFMDGLRGQQSRTQQNVDNATARFER